jgi:hypothetical protein
MSTPFLQGEPAPPPGLVVHTAGDAATVFSLSPRDESHWRYLLRRLTPGVAPKMRRPLRQVLSVARANGCQSVVLEHRYIDPDYRSEYSSFWSRRFDSKPDAAERLHFFARELNPDAIYNLQAADNYLGYAVLRPTVLGPLGRTVLQRPLTLANAQLTLVHEEPSLFGNSLPVSGVPFMQQDGELLRCAHTAAWLCHYVAANRNIIGRRPTGEIATLPPSWGTAHRELPSSGLTAEQMQAIFSALRLPAIFYDANDLAAVPGGSRERWDGDRPPRRANYWRRRDYRERMLRVVCKYLNSGFPVVVVAQDHAFTLVGWERHNGKIRLIACDDQVGPYEVIDDPLGHRKLWKALMIPVPEKAFLSGEAAETHALRVFRVQADRSALREEVPVLGSASLPNDVRPNGRFSLRSRLIEGRRYKQAVTAESRGAGVSRLFRFAQLPHWIWLVELQVRALRDAGQPCVIAEVVLGTTSHDDAPTIHLIATESFAGDVSRFEKLADVETPEDLERIMVMDGVSPWPSQVGVA